MYWEGAAKREEGRRVKQVISHLWLQAYQASLPPVRELRLVITDRQTQTVQGWRWEQEQQ